MSLIKEIIGETKIDYALRIITILGAIAFAAHLLWAQPWGPKLGVVGAPGRILLLYSLAFLYMAPFAILAMYAFAKHPEWNTPPGKYVPGQKVKINSAYVYSATAIIGALFGIAGIGNPLNIDLQALTIAASASYFGAIVSFGGLWIGQLIWHIIGGALSITSVAWLTMDAGIWAVNGLLYFKFLYGKVGGRRLPKSIAIPVVYIIGELIHSMPPVGVFWMTNVIQYPAEAFPAAMVRYWIYWPISWVVVMVGMLAGMSARRAVGGENAVAPPDEWATAKK